MTFKHAFLIKKGMLLSISGGGGKTSTLYTLASHLIRDGATVLITTTTAMFNPQFEKRPLVELVTGDISQLINRTMPAGTIVTAAKACLNHQKKLKGYEPGEIDRLKHAGCFDYILVETDGSRGLPVKAPDTHEPPVPQSTDIMCGIIGIECLGKPMDTSTVHRPGCFTQTTGLKKNEIITPETLSKLCLAKNGLFKNAPDRSSKIIILNKADTKEQIQSARETAWKVLNSDSRPRQINRVVICSMNQGLIHSLEIP